MKKELISYEEFKAAVCPECVDYNIGYCEGCDMFEQYVAYIREKTPMKSLLSQQYEDNPEKITRVLTTWAPEGSFFRRVKDEHRAVEYYNALTGSVEYAEYQIRLLEARMSESADRVQMIADYMRKADEYRSEADNVMREINEKRKELFEEYINDRVAQQMQILVII